MPEYKKHEGAATGRTRRKIAPLLNEWYGEDSDSAAAELIKYLPGPVSIDILLERVVKKKIPASRLLIFRIQEDWKNIAGEAAAKYTRPFCLKDGILDIEVSHPAYRAALTAPSIRDAILKNVRTVTGDDLCRELRFIPAGRRPPPQKSPEQ